MDFHKDEEGTRKQLRVGRWAADRRRRCVTGQPRSRAAPRTTLPPRGCSGCSLIDAHHKSA
jgi:hypothetical protein